MEVSYKNRLECPNGDYGAVLVLSGMREKHVQRFIKQTCSDFGKIGTRLVYPDKFYYNSKKVSLSSIGDERFKDILKQLGEIYPPGTIENDSAPFSIENESGSKKVIIYNGESYKSENDVQVPDRRKEVKLNGKTGSFRELEFYRPQIINMIGMDCIKDTEDEGGSVVIDIWENHGFMGCIGYMCMSLKEIEESLEGKMPSYVSVYLLDSDDKIIDKFMNMSDLAVISPPS